MHRVRRPVLAGVLAGAVVLVTACSDPVPAEVPAPAATSAAAPSAPPATSAAPTAGPTTEAATPSAVAPKPQGSEVPSRPVETAAPRRLDEPTTTSGGARVSLVSVKAETIEGNGTGDASGPGVLVRLEVANPTGRKVDTSYVQVNVTNAAGDPGSLFAGPPSDPVAESVAAGRSARGTYAFRLADATAGPVTVLVTVRSGQPVLQFRGQVS